MKLLRQGVPSTFMATTQAPTSFHSAVAKAGCLLDRQAGAASVAAQIPDASCTLSKLYEVVRNSQRQQLQEGLTPLQVQHVCHIIGEGSGACWHAQMSCLG